MELAFGFEPYRLLPMPRRLGVGEMLFDAFARFIGDGIPKPDGVVGTSRDDSITTIAEADTHHRAGVPLQRKQLFPGVRIPDFQRPVMTAGDNSRGATRGQPLFSVPHKSVVTVDWFLRCVGNSGPIQTAIQFRSPSERLEKERTRRLSAQRAIHSSRRSCGSTNDRPVGPDGMVVGSPTSSRAFDPGWVNGWPLGPVGGPLGTDNHESHTHRARGPTGGAARPVGTRYRPKGPAIPPARPGGWGGVCAPVSSVSGAPHALPPKTAGPSA